MRYILTLILLTATATAYDPVKDLAHQKDQLTKNVNKADEDLRATFVAADKAKRRARKVREIAVRRSIGFYINALKKAQTYWTKKGNLEKAIQIRDEIWTFEKHLGFKPKPVKVRVIHVPNLDHQAHSDTEAMK